MSEMMEEEIKIRPAVMRFAAAMELKLRQNDKKGGWDRCSYRYLLCRLKEEVQELDQCFSKPDSRSDSIGMDFGTQPIGRIPIEEIIGECADVANFAMMIADNLQ